MKIDLNEFFIGLIIGLIIASLCVGVGAKKLIKNSIACMVETSNEQFCLTQNT